MENAILSNTLVPPRYHLDGGGMLRVVYLYVRRVKYIPGLNKLNSV